MLLRLTSVTVLALLSLSPPQSQSDEIAALKREMQALRAQQTAMERDLQTIKSLLQSLCAAAASSRPARPDPFANKTITLSERADRGATPARK